MYLSIYSTSSSCSGRTGYVISRLDTTWFEISQNTQNILSTCGKSHAESVQWPGIEHASRQLVQVNKENVDLCSESRYKTSNAYKLCCQWWAVLVNSSHANPISIVNSIVDVIVATIAMFNNLATQPPDCFVALALPSWLLLFWCLFPGNITPVSDVTSLQHLSSVSCRYRGIRADVWRTSLLCGWSNGLELINWPLHNPDIGWESLKR